MPPILPPIEAVDIPFERGMLLGYFYSGSGVGELPTLIMHKGFDGSASEMHFLGAVAAQARGYNVLTLDGPGRPAARHRGSRVFQPRWETVITPALDWLSERDDVDATQISIFGAGVGAYLAARAAAFEPRLAALVALDGVYDLGEAGAAKVPAAASYLHYTLRGGVAERIRCATLICEGQISGFLSGQPRELYERLTCPKRLMRLTSSEAAGPYGQSGDQQLVFARIFDWLDQTLGLEPVEPVTASRLESSLATPVHN